MLEKLISEINEQGFWINNLCQNSEGVWRANLVKHTPSGLSYWEFANGASAEEALSLAFGKTITMVSKKKPVESFAKKSIDIDSLLSGLENL